MPGDIVELQVVMSGVLDIFNGFGKVIRATRNKGGYYQVGVKYVDLKSRRRSAKTVLSFRMKSQRQIALWIVFSFVLWVFAFRGF